MLSENKKIKLQGKELSFFYVMNIISIEKQTRFSYNLVFNQ